jgi:hypothetical protein
VRFLPGGRCLRRGCLPLALPLPLRLLPPPPALRRSQHGSLRRWACGSWNFARARAYLRKNSFVLAAPLSRPMTLLRVARTSLMKFKFMNYLINLQNS